MAYTHSNTHTHVHVIYIHIHTLRMYSQKVSYYPRKQNTGKGVKSLPNMFSLMQIFLCILCLKPRQQWDSIGSDMWHCLIINGQCVCSPLVFGFVF